MSSFLGNFGHSLGQSLGQSFGQTIGQTLSANVPEEVRVGSHTVVVKEKVAEGNLPCQSF